MRSLTQLFLVRWACLLLVILGLTWLAALAGGSWGDPALAQTVPTLTPIPPVVILGPQATAMPAPLGAPACAAGYSLSVPVNGVTTLDLDCATVTLRARQGQTARQIKLVSIARLTVSGVDAGLLPKLAGWQRLTVGLRLAAEDELGNPILFSYPSTSVCFKLPAGATAYSAVNIFSYGFAFNWPNSWTRLPTTKVLNAKVCAYVYRPLGTYALFGTNMSSPGATRTPTPPKP